MMGLGRLSFILGSLTILALAGNAPAAAKECRMPKAPPGVALQMPPECRQARAANRDERASPERLRTENGFVDLGNGTQVRIGGRVRAEMGFRY
jgi:hypothetical protein